MMNTAKQPDINKISEILAAADAAEKAKNYPLVLPELEAFLDPLTAEQYKELENGIVEDGVKDALLVWKDHNTIVDGHNRLSIIKKHGLAYKVEEKEFADLDAVKRWMIRNQLGRRNLTKERFTYYIGVLYNSTKQDRNAAREENPDGKATSEIIGEQFGVAEKTVRRAGETAAGIDRIAKIKGALAKAQILDGKSDLTREDLKVIGEIKDDKVAEKVINKLEDQKVAAKAAPKPAAPKPVPKPTGLTYPVIFMKPELDTLSPSKVGKPPLAKEGIVYMAVSDENLGKAFKLLDDWDLNYEATFVFSGTKPYDGVMTKIAHTFMVLATRGHLAGPKAGKEKNSSITVQGDPEPMMMKIIEAYHGEGKKLDMRAGAKASKDWSVLEN